MKVRELVFASVAVVALLGAPQTRAQMPVVDWTSISHLIEQVQVLQQQLDVIRNTYQETVGILSSVSGLVHPETWAPELLTQSMRNPLPFSASSHPGYVGGLTDPSSLPYGSQYLGQNTVGGDITAFQDGSFNGAELLRGVRSISSMMALATNNVTSIEGRISALSDIFNQLSGAGDVMAIDSVSARLHAESNYVQSQQVQSQNLHAAAQMELAAAAQRQKEWAYLDEKNGIKTMCGALSANTSSVTIPECSNQ